jgi:hypothetical protein
MSDDSQLCSFKQPGTLFYSDFERDHLSESNDMPHVRMHPTTTSKIKKQNSIIGNFVFEKKSAYRGKQS